MVNTSSTVQLHPTVLDDVTETEFVGIGSNVKVRDVDSYGFWKQMLCIIWLLLKYWDNIKKLTSLIKVVEVNDEDEEDEEGRLTRFTKDGKVKEDKMLLGGVEGDEDMSGQVAKVVVI